MNRENHQDIRLGTIVRAPDGAPYIRQILPHGFESFQIMFWERIGDISLERLAGEVLEACDGRATISSLGMFGNPLTSEEAARDFGRCIEAAHLFDCSIVAGFTGALDGQSVPASIPRFKEVWSDLAKRAEDAGVRVAWENCDMGGTWKHTHMNLAHAPDGWELLFDALPSDALGLEWEPCHHMNSLIDPLPQLREWIQSGKIFHLHGKDATIDWNVVRTKGIRGNTPYIWHRTPGFGDTNWTDVISILRQNNWRGAIDIEGWHDPVYQGDLEMTGQVYGLNYLKKCRGGEFVANPMV